MSGPGGLLLVVPHVYAVPDSVLLVGLPTNTAKLRHLILLSRVTCWAPLDMLLGAKIYLQPTTNLNAQLWDKKIVFQTTKEKITQKKTLPKKKEKKSGEKAGERSWS
jgi:hypothetical protein